MITTKHLLLEIGTEELPPKALPSLSQAFSDSIVTGLTTNNITFSKVQSFATPRRLSVVIEDVASQQPDQLVEKRGPALAAAYDSNNQPTKALLGFCRSCNTTPENLQKTVTEKGVWLSYRQQISGVATTSLLQDIVQQALQQLPTPKRMRWGNLDSEFVRPVHWITALFGSDIVPLQLMNQTAANISYGHRFHAPQAITITDPQQYQQQLYQANVIASAEDRKQQIRQQLLQLAASANGTVIIDEKLLDEVSSMVEWPVAIMGNFDDEFLQIPAECLISAMKGHQKYFHLINSNNHQLLPKFITIANIASRVPEIVQQGNERVIRPRLADAVFFWQQDKKQTLLSRYDALDTVIFQKQLGTLRDKVDRVSQLACSIGQQLHYNQQQISTAAKISKCDLLTEMVFEFPELQGIMGSYYAQYEGYDKEICAAMQEIYLPRFAGDQLPQHNTGTILALADRLDTIVAIFALDQKPSGTKDPFALRRASLAVLRLLIENKLPLDLADLLSTAATILREQIAANSAITMPPLLANPASNLITDCYQYIIDRSTNYFGDLGISTEVIQSVIAMHPTQPLDMSLRIHAVQLFSSHADAASLSAANKRTANILRKNGALASDTVAPSINPELLQQQEERDLFQQMSAISSSIDQLLQKNDYAESLATLAQLRQPIDTFFDKVMVMAEEPQLQQNRIALLHQLYTLFTKVADISQLSISGENS